MTITYFLFALALMTAGLISAIRLTKHDQADTQKLFSALMTFPGEK